MKIIKYNQVIQRIEAFSYYHIIPLYSRHGTLHTRIMDDGITFWKAYANFFFLKSRLMYYPDIIHGEFI